MPPLTAADGCAGGGYEAARISRTFRRCGSVATRSAFSYSITSSAVNVFPQYKIPSVNHFDIFQYG